MLNKGFLRKEISRRLSRRLGLTLTVGLAAGLLLSLGVILLFAKLVEDVVQGESLRFDEAGLLWIYTNSPTWLDEPMRVVTTLGYYWVILPLLAALAYAFYHRRRKVSAALLVILHRRRPSPDHDPQNRLPALPPRALRLRLRCLFLLLPECPRYPRRRVLRHPDPAPGVAAYGVLALGGSRPGYRPRAAHRLLAALPRRHYPTDILAGFLSAPLWVSFIGLCYLLWRTFRRHPSGKVEGKE